MRTAASLSSVVLLLVSLLSLVTACSSVKRWGKNLDPTSSAPPGACGREPVICVDGQPQCTTDGNGCTTCTCTPGTQASSPLNPRMPPAVDGPVR